MKSHQFFALLAVLPSIIAYVLPQESPDTNLYTEPLVPITADSATFDLTDASQLSVNPAVSIAPSNAIVENNPSPNPDVFPLFPDTGPIASYCRDNGKTHQIRSEKKKKKKSSRTPKMEETSDIALIESDEEEVDGTSRDSCPATSVISPAKKPPTPKRPTTPELLPVPDTLDTTTEEDNQGCKAEHPIRLCSKGEPNSYSPATGYWKLVFDCYHWTSGCAPQKDWCCQNYMENLPFTPGLHCKNYYIQL